VLDFGGFAVVVTTHCEPANDPPSFAAHGIDLEVTRLLCVKANNYFRAAFAERCAASIDVDCPCTANTFLAKSTPILIMTMDFPFRVR
jgi:microcystin degradation protein MlrC